MSENRKYDWKSWREQQEREAQARMQQGDAQDGFSQLGGQSAQQGDAQDSANRTSSTRSVLHSEDVPKQGSTSEVSNLEAIRGLSLDGQSLKERGGVPSFSQNSDRELYDYSQAAIRSDWGSRHAEESAELVHRATVAAGGYSPDKVRVKMRKESEFPSSVRAPYQEDKTRRLNQSADDGAGRSDFSRAAQAGTYSYDANGGLSDDARQAARVRSSQRRAAAQGTESGSQVCQGARGNAAGGYGSRADSFGNNAADRGRNYNAAGGYRNSGGYVASRGGAGGSQRSSQGPKKRSKKPFIVVGIILLIVLIAIGGYALASQLSAGGSNDSQAASEEQLKVNDTEQMAAAVSDDLVMNLNGDADTIVLKGEDYIESGCHVINKQTGANMTDQVKTEGGVDTSTAGDYSITYSVLDETGATCSKERTVHVVDSIDADTDGISVLMYHYVYTESDKPDEVNGNYILDTDLDAQLAWLASEDYYFPSYEELSAYIAGTHSLPQKSVVVTFDDGETGFLKYGIPLLEKYKVPATSFVIASDVDAADKVRNYASEYVSFQSHSYAMHQAGSDVGRGGRIHAMTQEEIMDDLQTAAGIVQNNEAMAYPFGDNNETAHAAIRQAGILCAFTINNDQVRPGDDPTCLSRVRISGEYSLDGFTYSVQNGVG